MLKRYRYSYFVLLGIYIFLSVSVPPNPKSPLPAVYNIVYDNLRLYTAATINNDIVPI